MLTKSFRRGLTGLDVIGEHVRLHLIGYLLEDFLRQFRLHLQRIATVEKIAIRHELDDVAMSASPISLQQFII